MTNVLPLPSRLISAIIFRGIRRESTVSVRRLITTFPPSFPTRNMSTSSPKLVIRKALVLRKFSRLEFEKTLYPELSEDQLKEFLTLKGSNYDDLVHRHKIQEANRQTFIDCLKRHNIETRDVDRLSYTHELVDWADVVFSAGGDGTFLMAANKIATPAKVIIGVNTDPGEHRSVGWLCVPSEHTRDWDVFVDKLINGNFEFLLRQRIKTTVEGESASALPIQIHNKELHCSTDGKLTHRLRADSDISHGSSPRSTSPVPQNTGFRVLDDFALNEVFVGESHVGKVSYFEVAFNGEKPAKLRSSGLTVCTGTGSTSWSFNINKLTPSCVKHLMEIINREQSNLSSQLINANDADLVTRVTNKFNASLIFDPSTEKMAYTVRDPITRDPMVFKNGFESNSRGFSTRITVKSRMSDGVLVLDGTHSYSFNNGSVATFEIDPKHALRTIVMK